MYLFMNSFQSICVIEIPIIFRVSKLSFMGMGTN